MKKFLPALRKISITFWVGGLWVIGYLVAPILFSALSNNRPLAGTLAGKMFGAIGWTGIACGAFLLIYQFTNIKTAVLKHSTFWLVVLMFAIALVLQFWIQPVMAMLRSSGAPVDFMGLPLLRSFAFWHSVSSTLYLIQSVLGLVLILKDRKNS